MTFDSDNLNIPMRVDGVQLADNIFYNVFYSPNTGPGELPAAHY